MAEDRPDRHPEPEPPAAAGSEAAPSHPSGGTDGSAATGPDGTATMPAPDRPATDDDTASQDTARTPAAAAGEGEAAADGTETLPAEQPRPAPWRGAAVVPPPGPKKRRRFGFGRDRAEEQPDRPLDPTLDLPAPVDPWEGTADWDEHVPDQHYEYPPPPPTRIDRADLPRTTVEPPARQPGPPPQPPRSHQPQPPPSQPPPSQPPRSQPPRAPQPPPQYAPPSYTRPQQPPPPPPPAQSRPVPPPAPAKKRKKDRKQAARPQLPARPPGYPPPGYPPPGGYPPPQMRRRRRRRWPMVLLTMLLLTVACCCGVPAYFGTPLWQQYPAKASLPEAIADLSLRSGAEADETSQSLEAEMRGAHLLAESTFAGVYGDAGGKQVTVFGVTGFRWSPETDLEAEMTRLTEVYGLSGVEPVDAGDSGGFQRCGTGEADGATVVVCGWADHGSLGTAVFTRRSVADSAALLDRIRGAVITREQITV